MEYMRRIMVVKKWNIYHGTSNCQIMEHRTYTKDSIAMARYIHFNNRVYGTYANDGSCKV